MADWSRRQQALLVGLVAAVAVLATVTVVVWPDDDTAVASADPPESSTTAPPTTTTTSTTTIAPTTTTAATTTTATTAAPTTAATSTTTVPTTTAPRPSPAPTSSSTTVAAPPYRSSVERVTAAQLGSSYTPGKGCTAPADLRAVDVTHWGYDGNVRQGRVIVAAAEADRVAAVFADLYAARFPIQRIEPVDRYGADDQASMRANNTSGYNCRTVAGTTSLSNHAFGKAIDVNPLHNPYVKGGTVDPPEGARWADRSNRRPGMIFGGDAVVTAFSARGWAWGGYWNSGQDYQHFDT